MKTEEIVRKHQKRFTNVRRMMKLLVALTLGMLVYVQWDNLVRFFSWLFSRN